MKNVCLALFLLVNLHGLAPRAHGEPGRAWVAQQVTEEEPQQKDFRKEEALVKRQVETLRSFHFEWPDAKPCADCEGQLCTSHMESEQGRLSACKAAWANASEEERLDLIQTLAHLSLSHSNQSNPDIGTYLVLTMTTAESWQVRTQAAYALANQPRPVDYLNDLKAHMLACVERSDQQNGVMESRLEEIDAVRKKAANAKDNGSSIQQSVKVFQLIYEMTPVRTQLSRIQTEWGATLMAIGRCQDPRASDLVLRQAKSADAMAFPDCLREALLESPTRDRVQAALIPFKAFERESKKWDKEIKSARKERTPRSPKGYQGSSSDWDAYYARHRQANVDRLLAGQDSFEKMRAGLHESLNLWLESQSLKPVEVRKGKYNTAWKKYYSKNRHTWPKALGLPPDAK